MSVMADSTDDWPAFSNVPKEHLLAIGSLVVAWNEVETAYSAFFQLLLAAQVPAAIDLFYLLGNDSRWQFISDESKRSLPASDAANVAYFLKCAAICKENRNAVVHADVSPQKDPTVVMLTKGRDPTKSFLKQYWLSVEALRQMADETRATALYGIRVWSHINITRTHAAAPAESKEFLAMVLRQSSLERPPLPRKWHLHSLPNPASVPPPPQSSET